MIFRSLSTQTILWFSDSLIPWFANSNSIQIILNRENAESGFTISYFQVDSKSKLLMLERNVVMKNVKSAIFCLIFFMRYMIFEVLWSWQRTTNSAGAELIWHLQRYLKEVCVLASSSMSLGEPNLALHCPKKQYPQKLYFLTSCSMIPSMSPSFYPQISWWHEIDGLSGGCLASPCQHWHLFPALS